MAQLKTEKVADRILRHSPHTVTRILSAVTRGLNLPIAEGQPVAQQQHDVQSVRWQPLRPGRCLHRQRLRTRRRKRGDRRLRGGPRGDTQHPDPLSAHALLLHVTLPLLACISVQAPRGVVNG